MKAPLFNLVQQQKTLRGGGRVLTKIMLERLHQQQTFEGAVATLLHDVVALHGAEFGDVQLPVGDELVIVAQIGFGPDFLTPFKRVDWVELFPLIAQRHGVRSNNSSRSKPWPDQRSVKNPRRSKRHANARWPMSDLRRIVLNPWPRA